LEQAEESFIDKDNELLKPGEEGEKTPAEESGSTGQKDPVRP
jgi:hypothetical protein